MKTLTREELAKQIDGREYREELTTSEESIAKGNHLVVVFGASDDLTEFRGAIYDEAGAYEEATHEFNSKLRLINNNQFDKYTLDELKREGWTPPKVVLKIDVKQTNEVFWYISSDVPHSRFTIMEDGEKYCSGIVIDLEEIGLANV